jgi:8-oxo-dGTP pyrophosphatase MutT (NUDIX family)
MLHTDLICKLRNYKHTWGKGLIDYHGFEASDEMRRCDTFLRFLEENPRAFDRSLEIGHVTASALITAPDFKQVVLLLHKKLDMWIQLGGHADGNPLTLDVSKKEAAEEAGLSSLDLVAYHKVLLAGLSTELSEMNALPFDIDIHSIPARKNEAEHLHYDVRYLFMADPKTTKLRGNHESKDLCWLTIDQARKLTSELSMRRQFHKLEAIGSAMLQQC